MRIFQSLFVLLIVSILFIQVQALKNHTQKESLFRQAQRYKCSDEKIILLGDKGTCKCHNGDICEFSINKDKGEKCPCQAENAVNQRYDCLREARRNDCDLNQIECIGKKGKCTCQEDPTITAIWDGKKIHSSCKIGKPGARTKTVGRKKNIEL